MQHPLQLHREIIPGAVMDFLILGRSEAVRIVPEAPHIVISITTPGAEDVTLPESPHRLDVLRLQFHDLEAHPQSPSEQEEVSLISDEQALSIVRFVKQYRDAVRLIVCQCDAGMSRSAAVAAALSRWLQQEEEAFFRYYLPNGLVYDTVLRNVCSETCGD